MSVDEQVDRERKFHDEAYESDSRRRLSGFYSSPSPIRKRYEDILLENCTGKQVLEYGCGRGSSGFLLASHGAEVTGIDISEYAINEAIKRAQKANLKINFQVMDAERLKFPDHSFDFVCGTGILHHLKLQEASREIQRVLKPGGRAIFIEPLGHNPLINIFRKLTPSLRSPDEHPLRIADLKMFSDQFPRYTIKHYYLLALCWLPLYKMKSYAKAIDIWDGIDQKLFNLFPFLKKYSWQVLILLQK
jgi:ubiquinone/menaquinone biosynthesis C-methylase UbiE